LISTLNMMVNYWVRWIDLPLVLLSLFSISTCKLE